MKKWIILILIIACCAIVVFFICRNNKQDLGDNYYYLPEYEAVDIGFPDGAVIYKAKQKNVFNDIKIRGKIVDVISNPEFIIALQKKDSANFNNDSMQYYIIAKKTDSIYGPYETQEYLKKRKELKIPNELALKEE